MPSGVAKDFLDHARDHQRHALLRVGLLAAAGLLGGIVAELLDPGRAGPFVVTYGVAVAAGLALGGAVGWLEVRSWADSLADGWQRWMEAAVGAGSMPATAERAGARRLTAGRAAGAVLVAANAACLIAAWSTLPPFTGLEPYGAFAVSTVAVTGAAVGGAATKVLVEAWWCREVEGQTLALVEEGRVGVWGYR
jgi:hypothetical protein